MDANGRVTDNIFIEQLWRSLKYEYLSLHPASEGPDVIPEAFGSSGFIPHKRHHQTVKYRKPVQLDQQGHYSLSQ